MSASKQFNFAKPRDSKIDDRKERFASLNRFVTSRRGWLTSVPGAPEVALETLPGSTLPDDLRKLGYDVIETGEDGERILPGLIIEQFTVRADGEFEPLTEGSTRPVMNTVTHAGITRVKRYRFEMP